MSTKADIEAIYTLSPIQQGILFHAVAAADPELYFIQTSYELRGPLDADRLARAWQAVAARHPVLRTAFLSERRDKPLQVVYRQRALPWDYQDYSDVPPTEQATQRAAYLAADRRRGFRLDEAPLMRLALLHRGPDHYDLVWSYHHLLLDGWAAAQVFEQAITTYKAFCRGTTPVLARPRPYQEYITWLKQQDLAAAERFWRQTLQDVTAPTTLGVSSPAGPVLPGYGQEEIAFSAAQQAAIQQCARQHRVTPNILFQAAWAVVLSRYTGQERVVFGATVAGRPPTLPGAETMIGLFINTLPVVLAVPPATTVAAWLPQIQDQVSELYQYEYSPLAAVQGWSAVPRGEALFESILVFENQPVDEAALAPDPLLEIVDATVFENSSYPLSVVVAPGRDLRLRLHYDQVRFDRATITRLLGHIQTVLLGLIAAPQTRLADLPLLTAAERQQILEGWQSPREAPPADTVPERFAAQVARTPDAVALVADSQQLTYAALNAASNRLAHHLQALGVGPETRVACCLERTADLVVGMLAILKAGGAYVPLEPAYPSERLAFILADTQPALLLAHTHLRARLPALPCPLLCLDADLWPQAEYPESAPRATITSSSLAYIMYTSGSTGQPKGIGIPHRGIVRLIEQPNYARLGPDEVVLHLAPPAFDAATFEVWGSLLNGARLVLAPLTPPSLAELAELLTTQRITTLWLTAGLFHQMVEHHPATLAGLRQLLAGGDTLSLPQVRQFLAQLGAGRLINGYGPTENTTFTCCYPMSAATPLSDSVPLGRPIRHTSAYVLDRAMQPVPVGVAGELYTGGAGMARGYWRRPALTAERFVPDPFSGVPGARLYRTGDLVRWRPDGTLDFLGRRDHQVKIRGFRIELGEIESVLHAHPGVRACAVLAREDTPGSKRLVAYVVPAATPPAVAELRQALETALPDYMIPAAFVFLTQWPLTVNGKLDRAALPAPTQAGDALRDLYQAPQTPTEELLANIWADVLRQERVGIDDNFFELGGDSILSLQIVARIHERGLNCTVRQLLQNRTIRSLAAALTAPVAAPASVAEDAQPLVSAADRARLPAGVVEAYPLTALQAGMFFHSEATPTAALYHNIITLRIEGPFEEMPFARALQDLVARHPVLRTSFDLTQFAEPLQLVHAQVSVPLTLADLRATPPADPTMVLAAWLAAEKLRPFDPAQPPLLRVAVHCWSATAFQLTLSFHHAILDGWSFSRLLTELLDRYAGLRHDPALPLPAPPAARFADFVRRERAAVADPALRAAWQAALPDPAPAPLPRWPRPPAPHPTQAVEVAVPLPAPLSAALQQHARAAGLPLKTLLLAAHLRVLAALTNRPVALTGLVSNGRPETRDGDQVLGLFLNTLPLGVALPGGRWQELIQATFAAEQELVARRHYPLPAVQRLVGPAAHFEAAFNFTHFHSYQQLDRLADLRIADSHTFEQTSIPLVANFNLEAGSGAVELALTSTADDLPATQLEQIGAYYTQALTHLVADPTARYDHAVLLPPTEIRQQIQEWNATALPYPEATMVPTLFAAQAARTPTALALVASDTRLSYADLDARANALAHYLQDQGIGPDAVVALVLDSSPDLAIAALAVLKAGGAYLPLDPATPAERLAYVLADSRAALVLTHQRLAGDLPPSDCAVCYLDRCTLPPRPDSPPLHAGPANLAYLIYTSGSTGRPKGVQVAQRNLLNLVAWHQQAFAVTAADRATQIAGVAFDAAVWELWPYLLAGAALHFPDAATRTMPTALRDWLVAEQITISFVPTPLAAALVLLDWPAGSLRVLLTGGDVLHPVTAAALPFRLVNNYGPTETTVVATSGEVVVPTPGADTPPIGYPIANTQIYLVDRRLAPVPIGTPGELYIGGAGVARGYQAQPALTAARFVPDPFSPQPGARMYATGDLARYRPSGQIEFLGRRDAQVKIRGFRIELGEIEAVLVRHPAVRAAVVVAADITPTDRRLVAYLVGAARDPASSDELRTFLKQALPDYMVPALFVDLASLPLTANGKVDRATLLQRAQQDLTGARPADLPAFAPPRIPRESHLAAVWTTVLRVPRVGIDDDFFALGGDSILSLQVVARAAQLGIALSPRQLFAHPTIRALAAVAVAAPARPVAHAGAGPGALVPIQRWFFEQEFPDAHHWNQTMLVEVQRPLDLQRLEILIHHLLAHHEALRQRFVRDAAGRHQEIAALEPEVPVERVDLSTIPTADQAAEREAAAGRVQASLNLATGPLLRAVLFEYAPPRPSEILLTIHHLAVDGVSWRILLEDLQTMYTQLEQGQAIHLPPRTTAYSRWGARLADYAADPAMQAEWDYWLAELPAHHPALPCDDLTGADTEATAEILTQDFSQAETQALLRELPSQAQAQIHEVLLTALGQTLTAWTGVPEPLIHLEGHGREDLFPDMDLSRTVGWFTALFPVRLPVRPGAPPAAALRAVQAHLRRVPNHGLGYSVLRYLGPVTPRREALIGRAQPEVSFNYLGQFDQVLAGDGLFSPASGEVGPAHSPQAPSLHRLDVSGHIQGNQLHIEWLYSSQRYRRDTIAWLAQAFENQVRGLIADLQRDTGTAPEILASCPAADQLASQ